MAAREASMTGLAGLRSSIYNLFIRRTSIYTTVCIAAAYATTEAYYSGTDRVWNSINRGVSYFYRSSIESHCIRSPRVRLPQSFARS